MTAQQYIEQGNIYESKVKSASAALKAITDGNRNSFGLTSDEVKESKEYIEAKKSFSIAFEQMRRFNLSVSNSVKKEAAKLTRLT